jgi:hypothetical protein
VFANEILRHERTERVTEEHDWFARMIGRDPAVEEPKVAYTFCPPIALGEKAEFGGRSCRPAVSAMIVGINRVASATKRLRHASVPRRMLCEPMGDLDNRFWGCVRQPAIDPERDAVPRWQRKCRCLHLPPAYLPCA